MERLGLLLVEDDLIILKDIQTIVDWNALGYNVTTAVNGVQGLRRFSETKPALVITDVKMPSMDGIEMSREIHKLNPYAVCMFLSAYDDFVYVRDAMRLGADDYVIKADISGELLSEKIGVMRARYTRSSEEQLSVLKSRIMEIRAGRREADSALMEAEAVCGCFPAPMVFDPFAAFCCRELGDALPTGNPSAFFLELRAELARWDSFSPLVRHAAAWLGDNYMDPDIKVSDVAREVGITERRLGELFRVQYGKTIGSYLVQMRMDAAKALLKKTDLRIYEIAERVGYKNSSHFSTAFLKESGISPMEYRQETLK